MHLLAAQPGALSDNDEAIDLEQSPGAIVFLSAADTDLALITAVLEASWAVLEASWGVLGRLGSVLGASWAVLGASWAVLEASWGRLGSVSTWTST